MFRPCFSFVPGLRSPAKGAMMGIQKNFPKGALHCDFTGAVFLLCQGGGHDLWRRPCHAAQREIVENKGWATEAELTDYFAIGQCTPGIIAVNTATFVGQKQAGILGGILATLGVAFPSVVIITCLASVISAFAGLKVIAHAFAGIRICVCVLIFNALLKLSRSSVVDLPTGLIAVTVALLAFFTDLSPAVFVLCAAVAGLAIQAVKRSRKKEAEG